MGYKKTQRNRKQKNSVKKTKKYRGGSRSKEKLEKLKERLKKSPPRTSKSPPNPLYNTEGSDHPAIHSPNIRRNN
jgi:hypothetical protein